MSTNALWRGLIPKGTGSSKQAEHYSLVHKIFKQSVCPLIDKWVKTEN